MFLGTKGSGVRYVAKESQYTILTNLNLAVTNILQIDFEDI